MHPVKTLYQLKLRQCFPPVELAFAYGSAVFKQHGREKGKMLDLVFAVNNPVQWHHENLQQNRHHYSVAQYLGSNFLHYVQRCDAAVYYNPMVTINDEFIKYGIISIEDLLEDLRTWKWLYISGRLHKPVVILSDEPESYLLSAMQLNLKSAALCALLLLSGKSHFTEEEFYYTICNLSYQGDFRMLFGEDKNKVYNIVKPNLEAFKYLYKVHLEDLGVRSEDGVFTGVQYNSLLCDHKALLPSSVVKKIENGVPLSKALSMIVFKSSIHQSCKGILTAGLLKSFKYTYDKVHKMIASLKSKKCNDDTK